MADKTTSPRKRGEKQIAALSKEKYDDMFVSIIIEHFDLLIKLPDQEKESAITFIITCINILKDNYINTKEDRTETFGAARRKLEKVGRCAKALQMALRSLTRKVYVDFAATLPDQASDWNFHDVITLQYETAKKLNKLQTKNFVGEYDNTQLATRLAAIEISAYQVAKTYINKKARDPYDTEFVAMCYAIYNKFSSEKENISTTESKPFRNYITDMHELVFGTREELKRAVDKIVAAVKARSQAAP